MATLHGTHDLAADAIRPSSGHLYAGPMANWNEHWSEFPPVPSVVLFAEPKSATEPSRTWGALRCCPAGDAR
jgi:hypothetical protein